ncbi:MAG TPA: PorP/SprF family type IX secretion system membrane protein [Bacteroidales bacterium]|nr:PorP/SprF family type IX secretion system membrane protein [Bacteroidales bacterium]
MKPLLTILFFVFFTANILFPQENQYGPGYRTILMNNPAISGASGESMLRLSYLNFYPGNSYNLHSFYLSFDSYVEALHGGAGLWLSDDYLGGIINDTRGGISYAYSLRAGKDIFINAGLSAGIFHRGYNTSDAVLPDMIDPLGGVIYPSGESPFLSSGALLDISAGFLLMYNKFFAGFSIIHLSQPDMASGMQKENLRRKLFLNAAWDISLAGDNSVSIRPAAFMEFQKDRVSLACGSSLEFKNFAINLLLSENTEKSLDIQTGFSVKTGPIGIFYSYRFNVMSENVYLPFSLLHQAGLTFGLNSVNKRNALKAITLPEL